MKTIKTYLLIASIIFLMACGKKSNSSSSPDSNSTETSQEVINKNALIGYWEIPEGKDRMKYRVLSIDPMGTMTSYNYPNIYDHWSFIEPNNLTIMNEKGNSVIFEVVSVDATKLVLKDAQGQLKNYQKAIPPEGRE